MVLFRRTPGLDPGPFVIRPSGRRRVGSRFLIGQLLSHRTPAILAGNTVFVDLSGAIRTFSHLKFPSDSSFAAAD